MNPKGNGKGNGEQPHDPYDMLDFPCRFEIKVMGQSSNRFSALVESIVNRHLRHDELLNVMEKFSRGKRYVSLTYIIKARNKEQIRAIYFDLSKCPEVLMTL